MPGESYGQRILAGYSSWDCKSLVQLRAVFLSFLLSPSLPGASPCFYQSGKVTIATVAHTTTVQRVKGPWATATSISLALGVCASTRLPLLLSPACICLSVFPWMGSLSIEDTVRPNLTIPWSWKGNQHSRRPKTDARLSSCWASGHPTPQILKQSLVGTASPSSEAKPHGSNAGSTTDWLCGLGQ